MFFLLISSITSIRATTLSDSIKPLLKINKQFLVVVHIVRNQDGTAGISEAAIQSVLSQVNTLFNPIAASFTVCEFTYIDNFQYNMGLGRDAELDPLYRLTHRINIYFTGEPGACGNSSFGGIDEYGNIIIQKNCADVITIGRELGHFFGLHYTFENTIPELANGSNCSTGGDAICDTPADPLANGGALSEYIDPKTCAFIYKEVDANGDLYNPDVSNIMSYYSQCICLTFSHDQYQSMSNYYLSHVGTW